MENNQQMQEYDLESIFQDWQIGSCSYLRSVLTHILKSTKAKREMYDLYHASSGLEQHIFCYDEGYEKGAYEDDNYHYETQISPQDLIESWQLPFHQAQAIIHIYKALSHAGQLYMDYLWQAYGYLDVRFQELEIED